MDLDFELPQINLLFVLECTAQCYDEIECTENTVKGGNVVIFFKASSHYFQAYIDNEKYVCCEKWNEMNVPETQKDN